MADINPILAAARSADQQVNSARSAMIANNSQIDDSFNADAELQRQNAATAELVTRTTGLGQLQYEQAFSKNALDLGTDLGDASGIQAALAQTLISSRASQNAALDRINQKKSISFVDDPLQFIANHLSLNDDIEAHNAAEAKGDLAASQIAETNKLTELRAVAANRLKTTVTGASVEAAAQAARNSAQIVSDGFARSAIANNTNGIKELLSLSTDQLRNASVVFDAQNKQQSIAIAQAHLALSQEEFSWKKLEKDKAESANTYVSDTIIGGYKAMYPDNPNKWIAPNSPKLLALISGKLPLDGEMKAAYDIGVLNSRAANPDGTNRLLAASPADLLSVLKYNPSLGTDSKAVVGLITSAAQEAGRTPQYAQLVAAKDLEGQKKFVNDSVQAAFKGAQTVVRDPSNPYWLPSIDTIAKQTPGLQELPFYRTVIAPASAAGVAVNDPSMALSLGLEAVKAGKISLNNMAVDMATIYKQGQRVNIQSKQFIPLGLSPRESYNVDINTGGLISQRTDMTNPAEIIRAAMKASVNKEFFQQSNSLGQ